MEKVFKGQNATQAIAQFQLELTPEDLELWAKELRAVKPFPGQEVTKRISPQVTIQWKPELSTKAFEYENGGKPQIGSQVIPHAPNAMQ